MYAQPDIDVTVSDDSGDKTIPAGTPCKIVVLGEKNVAMESPDGWMFSVAYDDATPIDEYDVPSIVGYNAR